jgi:hypothetical protein
VELEQVGPAQAVELPDAEVEREHVEVEREHVEVEPVALEPGE